MMPDIRTFARIRAKGPAMLSVSTNQVMDRSIKEAATYTTLRATYVLVTFS
jgi:hypothetical protein